MNTPKLVARNLQLRYKKGPLVLELSEATVPAGEVVAMIGPNGGGKTTLLRTMAGLMPPASGQVFLDERPLYGANAISRRERAAQMAVVLTGSLAPGYLRVEELVDLGRIPYNTIIPRRPKPDKAGRPRTDQHAVRSAMETAGVDHLAHRRVGSLSDGERQRVLIARALAQEPRVILLDEPGAHLDPPHQTQLFLLLNRLIERGVIASALIATHNIHLALHFATTLCIVAHGTVAVGTPCALLDDGSVDRAFLSGGQGHSSAERADQTATNPSVRLDRSKGWFVPEE